MNSPLVEHLKENGPGDSRKGLSSALGVITPGSWRRVALRVRQRPVARVCLGLLVAFACGVGLGVGVAAMIAPQAEHGRSVVRADGDGTRVAEGATAGPVVAVRVREDAGTASRSDRPATELTDMAPPGADLPTEGTPAGSEGAVPGTPKSQLAYAVDTAAPAPRRADPADAAKPPQSEEAPVFGPPPPKPAADLGPSLQAVKGPLKPAENTESVVVERADAAEADYRTPMVDQNHQKPAEAAAAPEAVVSFEGAKTVSEAERAAVDPLAVEAEVLVRAPLPDAAGANGVAGAPDRAVALPPRPARKNLQLAALPMPRTAAWIRNAVTLPERPRDAMIAIIIDDMGIDQKRSKAIIGLSAPLTLSFIPYGYNLDRLTDAARVAGHEIMLHLPMEPLDPEANPGPKALMTTVSVEENRQRLLWALSRMDGVVGLNNHMGSKFTTWRPGMEMVMEEVAARGMLFVDSFTHNESVGFMLAQRNKLPSTARDVFIDHDIDTPAIERRLRELETIARRRGHAIGIAHPHDLTREALEWWIVDAQARGFDFVPVSHIIRRGMKSG